VSGFEDKNRGCTGLVRSPHCALHWADHNQKTQSTYHRDSASLKLRLSS